MPAAILSALSYPCHPCHPRSDPPPRGGDVPSPARPLATQNFLGRDVPAPTRTLNYFGGGDVSSPHLPRLRNQHPLGRDVPAPIQTLNYFRVGDIPSPHLPRPRNPELPGTRRPSPNPHHQLLRGWRRPVSSLPRPRNARHQFGTSRTLPQPVFKTLKGFQTVAGGKAVRPPPPVPRPQNSSPLRLRRGLGVVASRSCCKPSVPMNRDARRDHGDERKLVERASLGANVLCARRGPAQFCVLLRGLRACAPYREVAWTGQRHACRHALPGLSYPCQPRHPRPYPPPRGRRRLVAVASLATQNFLGRDVPAPIHTLNYFGVGDVSSPHLPRLRNQHPLGRDVPAPTRSIITSGLETSRLHTPHALATPVISSALPLPFPNPASKP